MTTSNRFTRTQKKDKQLQPFVVSQGKSTLWFLALLLAAVFFSSAQSQTFVAPVTGIVSDKTGSCRDNCNRLHTGIDVACNPGDPIAATYGGTVQYAGSANGGTEIVIDHGNGYWSSYSHMNSRDVPNGTTVSKGQRIGTCGDTGIGTGPHLHFQIANSNQGGKVYSPDGTTNWDDAAGIYVGQVMSQGSEIALAAPGLNDTGSVPPLATGDADPPPPEGSFSAAFNEAAILEIAPDAKKWFQRTIAFARGEREAGGGPDLFAALVGLGWAMTFALFVYAITNAIYFYKSDDYWVILGRLIIAVGLLAGAPGINKGLETTWINFHDWSEEAFVEGINRRISRAIGGVALASPSFLLGMAALDNIEALNKGGTAGVSLELATELDPGKWIARGSRLIKLTLIVLVSMYGLYAVTVFSSGLVIIIAMLLLPILAALFLWPGMSTYLSRWASMVLTAFAGLVFAMVVYAIAMDLAFVIPLENLEAQMKSIGTETVAVFQDLQPGDQGNWVERQWQRIKAALAAGTIAYANMQKFLVQFILQAIFVLIGIFMGFYLLINFEGLLSGFLSGAASSGARQASSAIGGALTGGATAGSLMAAQANLDKFNASQDSKSALNSGGNRQTLSNALANGVKPSGGQPAALPKPGGTTHTSLSSALSNGVSPRRGNPSET